MIFLGIDIGFDRCGFCALEYEFGQKEPVILSAGAILTDKKLSIQERLKILHRDLLEVKKKFKPEYVSIEKLFFHRKNMTFEKICMSKGVAMTVFADTVILEIEPKRVKKYITGNGNATKEEIRVLLEKIMNMDLKNIYDDTIDAVCLGLYHVDAVKLERLSRS